MDFSVYYCMMQFADIIGQEETKKRLITSFKMGKMAHALLFLGPEGSANLHIAFAFAQYIFCKDKTENDSCGKCTSCIKASKLVHPDLHLSFPVIGDKEISDNFLAPFREAVLANPYLDINDFILKLNAENKQANITALECRNMIKKLSLKTYESAFKILVIWLPEYLKKEGNILLKMIEEPTENTLIFMVVNDEEKLLTTIRSRLQLVKIKAFNDAQVSAYLQNKLHIEEEKADILSRISNGNINAAIKNIENQHDDNLKLISKYFQNCVKGDRVAFTAWADEVSLMGREQVKQMVNYLLHLVSHISLKEIKTLDGQKISEQEKQVLQIIASKMSLNKLMILSKRLNLALSHLDRNSNIKISMMNMSLDLALILNRPM